MLACPPSAGYRFQKFARRNRGVLAAAGAVLAALVLGLVGTSWLLFQAIKAEERVTVELRGKNSEIAKMVV